MNAIEQAIEALEYMEKKSARSQYQSSLCLEAIEALQSMRGEAGPVAYLDEDGRVVRVSVDGSGDGGFVSPNRAIPDYWRPLYTHPQNPAVMDLAEKLEYHIAYCLEEQLCNGAISPDEFVVKNRKRLREIIDAALLTASGKGE
jgi:hypothetical protein